jgi:predicted acylesterase/phospholipase RssA
MEHPNRLAISVSRDKLGLALAGGGFRASIFHLGVLRRLAELDLLRRVEVLSTVSGGSVVGALYILLLKRNLETAKDGNLTRDGYIALVDELERLMLRGIRKNLRTRVVMNPLGVLRMALTSQSLGQRMALMYERHVYADVVKQVRSRIAPRKGEGRRRFRPGELPLRDLRIHPGGASMKEGLEDYNRKALEEGRSVSTRLVLNATSLNSGGRFWFSSVEVGDWYLGHVRHGEIDKLEIRKRWLDESHKRLQARRQSTAPDDEATLRGLAVAEWWKKGMYGAPPPGGYWDDLFAIEAFPGKKLVTADPGLLRQLKLPAWYLGYGPTLDPPIRGGVDRDQHWMLLWDALGRIDGDLADELHGACDGNDELSDQLLSFILELYWIQSAELVSPYIRRFWQRISLGDAVGASANFPPVFPPFPVLGLYDDLHVARMGLTDGGVFDNMGLTALEDEGCNQIIASDTGSPRTQMEFAPGGRIPMLVRIIGILQSVLGSAQRVALSKRRQVSRTLEPLSEDESVREFLVSQELKDLAYFHIDSDPVDPTLTDPDYPPPLPRAGSRRSRLLADLRTDLDAFSEQEAAALVNRGYAITDRYVRRFFKAKGRKGSLWNEAWSEPPVAPHDIHVEDAHLDRTLKVGHARFFKGLSIGAPISVAFTLGVLGLALWFLWPVQVSVRGVLNGLEEVVIAALHAMAPWFRADWTTWEVSLGFLLVTGIGVLVVFPILLETFVVRWAGGSPRKRRIARQVASGAKWPRYLLGNVFWVLGLFPILVAVSLSVTALVSDLFFMRPYLWATRNRKPAR